MARSRNIKPGFFQNDELAEIEPLGRLLFAGLWTIADRDGRLCDRPKRIKAEILPYDECDVDDLLGQLAMRGFVLRYRTEDGADLIQITTWERHQNPHVNEAQSVLAPYKHGACTIQEPESHSTNREDSLYSDNLYSDNLYSDPLIEDSLVVVSPPRAHAHARADRVDDDDDGPQKQDSAERPFDATTQQRIAALEPSFAAIPGFQASPRFWQTALDKYGDLDLDEEAVKLAAWAADHPEAHVTVGTVLTWLKREAQTPKPRRRAGAGAGDRNATQSPPPHDPVDYYGGKYGAYVKH